MYESFYNLEAKPFQLSPDPRFFFGSRGHRRALAYLRYGLGQGDGFVVVTGGVGTGKSTLVQMLLAELKRQRNVVAAQLVMTQLDPDDLLRMVAGALGLENEGLSKAALLRKFESYLRKQRREGKRVLLLLDEAQNLPARSLESLRMLSNFLDGEQPLIQSFLLGQAEFRDTLSSPRLEQMRQRVIASCHLTSFEEEETRSYIEHRLRNVGWKDDPDISEEAFQAIHQYTRGVPRSINTFCDRLLLFGYLEGLHQLDVETVESVAQELNVELESEEGEDGEAGSTDGQSRMARLERRIELLEEALSATRDGLNQALAERYG
ncbi:XrtA/PEP-CTERM system-associated ATPase [Thiohalorhabdus methylotrophus]|uniref:XrtA/PEP-CTERM system-associated ATPase n=1 Tax=Thiohalorhabdus methylotrophus TaxID=3242694 RepID=A0ABV4TUQ2_9GAMM